ncbi:hypothetical protein ACIOUE_00980 [Streptomyces xanthochromogenes]|uniref:hypothetical protein n=1 Tax=Streptomyces xanthochromogenes TaxID=67384 RepID=UPI00382980D8
MRDSMAGLRRCSLCGERTGLGVLEWARTTWWHRLTRRSPVVVLHVHVRDEAALDRELHQMLNQAMRYKPYPR